MNAQWFLVGGSIPLKNISQIGSSSQLLGKIKNVPNHQPDFMVWKDLILQHFTTLPHMKGRFSFDRQCHGPRGPTDDWFSSHIWHQKKMNNGKMTGQSWENHWDIHGSCLFLCVFFMFFPCFWEHHGLLTAAFSGNSRAPGLGFLDETFPHLALDAGGKDLPHLLLEELPMTWKVKS